MQSYLSTAAVSKKIADFVVARTSSYGLLCTTGIYILPLPELLLRLASSTTQLTTCV